MSLPGTALLPALACPMHVNVPWTSYHASNKAPPSASKAVLHAHYQACPSECCRMACYYMQTSICQEHCISHAERCRDVVGVGEGVSRLQLGKRVALEPGIPCWGSKVARWVAETEPPASQAPSTSSMMMAISKARHGSMTTAADREDLLSQYTCSHARHARSPDVHTDRHRGVRTLGSLGALE